VDLLPLEAGTGARSIRALRSAVTRDEAIQAFAGGVTGRARSVALGPLRSVADVYVPFRLYRVSVERCATSGSSRTGRHATVERAVLGLDAVTGALDLYQFDREPEPGDVVGVHTRNGVAAALPDSALHQIAVTRVRRIVYRRRGFLVAGRVRVDVDPIEGEVHVPYWAGFFGSGETARIVVMDAVRRQIEGAKVRQLIGRWLAP
jgi:hypothetical protein